MAEKGATAPRPAVPGHEVDNTKTIAPGGYQVPDDELDFFAYTTARHFQSKKLTEEQTVEILKTVLRVAYAQPNGGESVGKKVRAAVSSAYGREPNSTMERFLPHPYTVLLADQYRIKKYGGEFFAWDTEAEFLRPWKDEIAWRLEKWRGDDLTPGNIKETRTLLSELTTITDEDLPPANLSSLRNGVLDVETGDFDDKHDPNQLFLSQLPVAFKPEAKSPLYDDFLRRALPDPLQQDLWHEMLGCCLIRDTRYQVAFILTDYDLATSEKGNTGKSTAGEIAARMVGEGNCCRLPLSDLFERFSTAGLEGKMLNICTEVDSSAYIRDSQLKQLISGEPVKVEHKYEKPYTMRPYTKLLISCNKLPRSLDGSEAYLRRFRILVFNQKLPLAGEPGNIPDFAKTLSQEDLDYVFLRRARRSGPT